MVVEIRIARYQPGRSRGGGKNPTYCGKSTLKGHVGGKKPEKRGKKKENSFSLFKEEREDLVLRS